eukprot:CAMPEP_0118920552 /NCGR_PEP_ID=MMETSP1166-20130328/19126_1 /TAXON_ID=1104430 /ORGANISM="Chrysoreinhardia sp, Strain CCMP3193" /LENGTH=368 /DNA_ID=CAMNT_0006861091 /DNA_START=102 /DNA_END=1205 /DNA_ORIENTATION=-
MTSTSRPVSAAEESPRMAPPHSVLQQAGTLDENSLERQPMSCRRGRSSCDERPREEEVPEVPDEFTCPITHEEMHDPVLLHTDAGRSYERSALEEHLRGHPYVDPLTNQRSRSKLVFTPNRGLKTAIEMWLRRGDDEGPRKKKNKIAAAQGARPSPSRSTIRLTTDAASKQLVDARDSEERKAAASARSALEEHLRGHPYVDPLTNQRSRSKLVFTPNRGLKTAIEMWLRQGDDEDHRTKRNDRRDAAEAAAALPPLVAKLTSGTAEKKEEAAAALQLLAFDSANDAAIRAAGAIPPLVALLTSGTAPAKEKAAAALRSLAVDAENHAAILAAGAIPPLVTMLTSGTDDGKVKAAAALQNLACSSENK